MRLFSNFVVAVFVCVSLSVLLFNSRTANAQLVDCQAFSSWYGALVCRDTQLSVRYMKMADLVAEIVDRAPNPVLRDLEQAQKELDSSLSSCRDVDVLASYGGDIKVCLKSMYDMEIAKLEQTAMNVSGLNVEFTDSLSADVDVQPDSPEVIYSKYDVTGKSKDFNVKSKNVDKDVQIEISLETDDFEQQPVERNEQILWGSEGNKGIRKPNPEPKIIFDDSYDDVSANEVPANNVSVNNVSVNQAGLFDVYKDCRSRSGDNVDSLEACVYSALEGAETELQVITSRLDVAMGMPNPDYPNEKEKSTAGFYDNVLAFRNYSEGYCAWMSSLFSEYIRSDLLARSCKVELYSQRINSLAEIADNLDLMNSVR